MTNNTTLSKEQILNRLEKSNPEQLEARLEMKDKGGKGTTQPLPRYGR